MAAKHSRTGKVSDPIPATTGNGEAESTLDTVDTLDLEELFALYSQKIRERDVLDQSLGITRRVHGQSCQSREQDEMHTLNV